LENRKDLIEKKLENDEQFRKIYKNYLKKKDM
jgi:hypothetical protein